MFISGMRVSGRLLSVVAVAALVAAPVIVYADASAPNAVRTHKAKKRAQAHRHMHKKAVAQAKAPEPMVEHAPMEVAQAPAPMPEPVPAAVPEPVAAPVAAAPEPAAPVAVAKHGGNGLILGLLGAAAAIGGIVALASNNSPSSP